MSTAPTVELLIRWRDFSDQDAAAEVFNRYVDRLVALARSRMSPRLIRRVDPDDVVQSACRSFFLGVRNGRLYLEPESELWQFLAAITIHKVLGQAEHHTAGKRSMGKEESHDANSNINCLTVEAVDREPTPDEVLAVAEEKDKALAELNPLHRQMVELRLQDVSIADIAAQTNRSERMVRIVLAEFGKALHQQLLDLSSP